MDAFLSGLTLTCIALGLVQLTFLLGLGRIESKRLQDEDPGDRPAWEPALVVALIPCLDEAAVIGPTVTALLAQHPLVRVVVILHDRARCQVNEREHDLPAGHEARADPLAQRHRHDLVELVPGHREGRRLVNLDMPLGQFDRLAIFHHTPLVNDE